MTNEELKALQKTMQDCKDKLREHVETVQIVVTVVTPDGDCHMFSDGAGNIYSRVESCSSWVDGKRSQMRGIAPSERA